VKEIAMQVPIIGILSSLAATLGLYGLFWYHNLTDAQRDEADRLATEHAQELYGKGLDELTSSQLGRIHDLVKAKYAA
jgi:hypothetical protein